MKRIKKGLLLLLAALLITGALQSAEKAQAAYSSGAVTVEDYNWSALYQQLSSKYPAIFTYGKHSKGGSQEEQLRFIMGAPSVPTAKHLDGSIWSNSSFSRPLSRMLAQERFTVSGNIAYCFDMTTPAQKGTYSVSSSVSAAGIPTNTRSEAQILELARTAAALTANNFALITQNADSIARAFTNSYNGKSYSKDAVAAVLKGTGQAETDFKRGLVQLMVWTYMNEIKVADQANEYITSGQYNKEGEYVGGGTLTPVTTGIGALYHIPTLYSIGKGAADAALSANAAVSYNWEKQYELEVGKTFPVPADDVGYIRKIAAANGGKIEASGSVTVADNGSSISLTATAPLPEWTSWLAASDVSNNTIYSTVPYQYAHGGMGENGAGQFIVNTGGVAYYRARVKAVVLYDPIDVLLHKVDAQTPEGASQGNASLAGAEYEVKFTAEDGTITTWIFKTDGNGYINYSPSWKVSGPAVFVDSVRNRPGFPAGTLTIRETKAPSGYLLDPTTYTVFFRNINGQIVAQDAQGNPFERINSEQKAELNTVSKEIPKKVSIAVTKNSDGEIPEGASLAGIRFAIVNTSEKAIVINGSSYAPGAVTEILSVDATGKISSGKNYPNGSYDIYELRQDASVSPGEIYASSALGSSIFANNDYLWKENKHSVTITDEDADGAAVAAEAVTNKPAYGRILIQKKLAKGLNADLSGFSFTVSGTADSGVKVKLSGTTDAKGRIIFENVPYGTYTVKETLSAAQKEIWLEKKAETVAVNAEEVTYSLTNELRTVKVVINKQNEDKKLDGFRFVLAGKNRLGQSVYLEAVTDAEGKASFPAVPHGEFVVAESWTGDQKDIYLPTPNQNISIDFSTESVALNWLNKLIRYPVSVIKSFEGGRISGWRFVLSGRTASGMKVEMIKETDEEGSLIFTGVPVGEYVVREEGVPLCIVAPKEQRISVKDKAQDIFFTNAYKEGNVSVSKKDFDTEELLAGAEFTLYEWSGGEYRELKQLDDNGDGTYSAAFKWTEENEGRFRLAETKAPEGYLIGRNDGENAWEFVVSDEALSFEFEAVNMKPEIATAATDASSDETKGGRLVPAVEKAVVSDIVTYKNLLIGKEYTVKGILMDKATNKPALDAAGKEITAEETFTPEEAEGSVELFFSFDAALHQDKELVAFERLYLEGEEIAAHADIEDEAQTVKVEKKPEPVKPLGKAPEMGDHSDFILPVIGLGASALGLMGTGFVLSRRRKKDAPAG